MASQRPIFLGAGRAATIGTLMIPPLRAPSTFTCNFQLPKVMIAIGAV